MKTKKIKFIDSVIKGLEATGEPYSVVDTEHKGLMVRASATATRSFVLPYHPKGTRQPRFLTFGQYPEVTLADAFRRHAEARADIANGKDPQAVKAEERALKKSSLTFDELVKAFNDKHLSAKRTARDGKR